jgi:hypothetical protein
VVTAIALDHGVELIEVEQPEVFGLCEDARELVAAELPGEVEDGAGDRGDRDPDDQLAVGLDQVPCPMAGDPFGAEWWRGTKAVTWIGFGDPDQSPQSHPAE